MKTVHVVVEGQADQILLEKLLHDLEDSVHLQFHIAEGKHSAHPLARTLQVRRGEPVAQDRTSPFQPDSRSLAARLAHRTRDASLYRDVFEHGAGSRAGSDSRLGRDLPRRRKQPRSMDGHHISLWQASRKADRARPRVGMRVALCRATWR